MSQTEKFEVVCRRCGRRDVLDHEPLENYRCSVCNLLAKPEEFRKSTKENPLQLKLYPYWRCANHQQTWKKNKPCLDCEKEEISPKIRNLNPTNTEYERVIEDIETDKAERPIRKKIRDIQLEVYQGQIDMPKLFKQFFEQQSKRDTEIVKQLKQLNKNLEDKNENS